MNEQIIIDMMQDAFRVALFLSMPTLLLVLIVGLAVAIFQSVTSIQEQTMAFVPKILAVMLALTVGFTWMLRIIIEYTQEVYRAIPNFVN